MDDDDPVYDRTLDAVKTMFSDDSVDVETSRTRLQGLRDEIDILLDSLE